MKECDFLVVGGGPAGMFFAATVGKRAKVVVVEEHETVGEPVQCTGLVTPRVVDMAGARGTVLNRLHGGYFHFPGEEVAEVRAKATKAVVVDRAAFDQRCASRAEEEGAEIALGERFTDARIGAKATAHCWDSRGSFNYTTKLIVGADGYKSNVAKTAGLDGPRDFVRGVQMDILHREEEQDMLDVYLGKKVAPGFFAWKIPCGDMTRVGLCVSVNQDAPMTYLTPLLKRLGLSDMPRARTISGMIPIGPLMQTYAERVLVIGDAAAQAKPLSGGGLYTGMVAARCAADTALESLRNDDFSAEALSSYQERWKAELGKELDRGFLIRKAYVKLSDRRLGEIGRILSRKEAREVLCEGDIDFPAELAPKVLKTAPGLLRLTPSFLRALFSRTPPANQK